ncbi:hypothetical protein DKX38_028076 [Salix brachista]|uniref:Uncharacterized protein n=1 Tax=Salix brachista TaxID=2182728 RepID=A0A5N5J8A4_9ROSI|nr:hypothetical protein DKX38_028076 [Salix brachista]
MTNGQNCLSGFEINGNLTRNCSWKPYSSRGPFKSWRPPIFGVPLKSKCGKAFRVAGLRVKALQKDESDNRLVGGGGGVIEKELELKPSFGEYLKAMESVKTGREKNQVHKSNSYKLKDDLEGNDAPLLERDERSVKSRGFKDRVKVSKVMESVAAMIMDPVLFHSFILQHYLCERGKLNFKIFLHGAANVPSAEGECRGAEGIITVHIFYLLLVTSFTFVARECTSAEVQRDYSCSYISLPLGDVVRLRRCSVISMNENLTSPVQEGSKRGFHYTVYSYHPVQERIAEGVSLALPVLSFTHVVELSWKLQSLLMLSILLCRSFGSSSVYMQII